MSNAAVTVHLFAAARAAVGADQLEVLGASLAEVIDLLAATYPSFSAVAPRCSFLVDGLIAHGDPAAVMLAPGIRIDVLPPFAGG